MFKCDNCGSSNFKKISEDLLECIYCSTKVKNSSKVKQSFKEDIIIDEERVNKKNIKFVKSKIKEDEFYKKALIHLTMNKNVPIDLLDKAKFEYVEYKYVFFAVADVDYEMYNVEKNNQYNKIDMAYEKNYITKHGRYEYFALHEDYKDFYDLVSNFLDARSSVFSKNPELKDIDYPNDDIIDERFEEETDLRKKEVMQRKKQEVLYADKNINFCEVNIKSKYILAIPVYVLSFEYNGNNYEIYSSAIKIDLKGEIPVDKKKKRPQTNKGKVIEVLAIISFILLLVFTVIEVVSLNLTILIFTLIFGVASIVLFNINSSIVKKSNTKINNDSFNTKKAKLKNFLINNSNELTKKYEDYIENNLNLF